MTVSLFNIIVELDSQYVPVLEDLAFEASCHCITHQPPHIDDWPAEINELPVEGPVVSIISFHDKEEALLFNQHLINKTGWKTTFEEEEILPWIEYHRPFMQPIQLGYLTILPQSPEDFLADNTLYLPAGLAFGTGQHATTRSCLLLLQEMGCHHHSIIDFGCGSGILGLAGLILGANHVQAYDHDPQALQATTDNALAHKVDHKLYVLDHTDKLKKGSVLCANILFDPLIELHDLFLSLLEPHGYAIFSGILETQSEAFKKRYQDNFFIIKQLNDDGWSSFLMQKIS
jgi:ribosomal protein L11 methyltransferase